MKLLVIRETLIYFISLYYDYPREMMRGYLNFLIPFLVKDCIFFLRPSIVFFSSKSSYHQPRGMLSLLFLLKAI